MNKQAKQPTKVRFKVNEKCEYNSPVNETLDHFRSNRLDPCSVNTGEGAKLRK